ncbi:MAG TPA: manganese efflux pump MntP family protein [Bacillaceae bacterium]
MSAVLPELITMTVMAFAVGMDAFSVSLGLGVYKLRLRQIFYIGLIIGIFHVIMPLIGLLAGNLLSETFGKVAGFAGGVLLMVLGMQMVFYCFRKDESTMVLPVGWGIFIFSLLVSLDSFSAGLSLGMFGARTAAAVVSFGVVAASLTWSGLLMGRKVQGMLGAYSELLGGCILILFGFKLLWPY